MNRQSQRREYRLDDGTDSPFALAHVTVEIPSGGDLDDEEIAGVLEDYLGDAETVLRRALEGGP